ncbi:MAG TPA: GNAT family N-acetyltransferase [Pyrinomonadaceae bacterium]
MRLRTWSPDDAADGHAIWSDPEVMRYIGDGQPHKDLERTRGWMGRMIAHQQQHGFCFWAVVDKCSNQLIGSCGLGYQLDGSLPVEFGYTLARDCWGRGLATEMAGAALRHAFAHLPLEEIAASVDSGNHASRRVLEKIGFVFDRTEQLDAGVDLWYKATRHQWRASGRRKLI